MIEGFLIAQVVALSAFWVYAVWKVRGVASAMRTALGLVAWMGLTAGLANAGLLEFGTVPPRILLVVASGVVITVWLSLSSLGADLSERLGLGTLIGFQAFRIFVELFLWWGYKEGFVPRQMSWEGRNWDVLSGLTAVAVAWLAARGRVSPRMIAVWNWVGLLLLANIVTVAVLSMPTPLQVFMNEPPNRFVASYPYIWLPVFLVQSALFGHLLLMRRLKRR